MGGAPSSRKLTTYHRLNKGLTWSLLSFGWVGARRDVKFSGAGAVQARKVSVFFIQIIFCFRQGCLLVALEGCEEGRCWSGGSLLVLVFAYPGVSGGRVGGRDRKYQVAQRRTRRCLCCTVAVNRRLLYYKTRIKHIRSAVQQVYLTCKTAQTSIFSVASDVIAAVCKRSFNVYARAQHIPKVSGSLKQLSSLGRLSECVYRCQPGPRRVRGKLRGVQSGRKCSFGARVLVCTMVSNSFSIFFKKSIGSVVTSTLVNVTLGLFRTFMGGNTLGSLLAILLYYKTNKMLSGLAILVKLKRRTSLVDVKGVVLLVPKVTFAGSLHSVFSKSAVANLVQYVRTLLLTLIINLNFAITGLLFWPGRKDSLRNYRGRWMVGRRFECYVGYKMTGYDEW